MNIDVGHSRCTGHGLRELEAADLFEVGDDRVVQLLITEPGKDYRDQVEAAVKVPPQPSASGTDHEAQPWTPSHDRNQFLAAVLVNALDGALDRAVDRGSGPAPAGGVDVRRHVAREPAHPAGLSERPGAPDDHGPQRPPLPTTHPTPGREDRRRRRTPTSPKTTTDHRRPDLT